jgi:O-methyltransferase domain
VSPQQRDQTTAEAMPLLELMFPSTVRCIAIAAEYRIADLLADGPRSVEELAEKSGTEARGLQVVLALLAEDGIFAEVDSGVFANTPLSGLLRPGVPNSQYSMARLVGQPWLWSCWGRLDHSVETGRAAFEEIYHTGAWAWFGQHPEAARLFDDAMTDFSEALGSSIARSHPELAQVGVVADLGGGQGSFLATVLATYPSIRRGLLVDLPTVIDQAKTREELAPLVQQGRLAFVPGDFFLGVPSGVDVYLTKQVMHSWSDEKVVALLQRCREASPDARVAAAELVQRPGVPRFVKNFNLVMLITMAGSIRTEDEFAAVFARAGYELRRVLPTGTAFSIVEAVPAGRGR